MTATTVDAERMTLVDRAWLEMDTAANPMVVAGIIELASVTAPMRWGREMVQRLLRYPRFRERPDDTSSPPRWLPDFPELGYHLRLVRLPRRSGEAALRAAIGKELGAELDRARPLWRVTVFPRPGRRLVVLFRAHHAMADGIALMRVLMDCTDAAMRKHTAALIPPLTHASRNGPLGGLIDRLDGANQILAGLRDVVVDDLQHPQHLARQWRDLRSTAGAVRRVLTLPQDNPPALRAPLSGHRSVAWLTELPFAPMRKLARQFNVKVNDVFMSVLASALGDALRARGIGMPDTQNLRASIPVNLRNGDDTGLGNCFGLVLLDLPIAVQDPVRCLQIVATRMGALKQSPEAKAVLASLALAGHLPVALEKKVVGAVGGKAAAVVSNLPGPRRHVSLVGARVESLVFWPPQAGSIGLGISLFTYAGRVSVGVSADTRVMPEPQLILDAFKAELAELQKLARLNDAS